MYGLYSRAAYDGALTVSVILGEGGPPLFKELCILFLPNVLEAIFIQEATSIPDSRVLVSVNL
jgi:hypothetical protein